MYMTGLEYRLADALLKRVWQRGLLSKEQYILACSCLKKTKMGGDTHGTHTKTSGTNAYGEIYL